MDQNELTRAFDEEYEQMLSDMFGWPWPDAPEDYVPLPTIPTRSHNLLITSHGSNDGRIMITDMEDSHLENCIAYFKRTGYPNNQHKLQLMIEEQRIRCLERKQERLL